MEQVKHEYREAQRAVNEGRTADAHRHVRAAGRELDLVAEALRRHVAAGTFPEDWSTPGGPAREEAAGGGSARTGIDAGAVAVVARDLQVLMSQVANLARTLDEERRQVRGQRHWRAREPESAPVRGGCLDFSR